MVWTPFTRHHHDRSCMRYASDLTDHECIAEIYAQPVRQATAGQLTYRATLAKTAPRATQRDT
ncbi:hypothetical protein JOH51_007042 [Rhizobium leguminosarum]|nr:hypothetical protein [Rhizobium leguminosarum]